MSTKHTGTEKERLALDTFIKLVRALNAFEGRTQEIIVNAGLTTSQFGVLEALYHLGDLNQSELSKKILKTGGNLTMVIDNLEKRQLVTRRRDTKDRRITMVSLTQAGKELISQIFPPHADLISKEMSILTPEEQQELGRLCVKLGRR